MVPFSAQLLDRAAPPGRAVTVFDADEELKANEKRAMGDSDTNDIGTIDFSVGGNGGDVVVDTADSGSDGNSSWRVVVVRVKCIVFCTRHHVTVAHALSSMQLTPVWAGIGAATQGAL